MAGSITITHKFKSPLLCTCQNSDPPSKTRSIDNNFSLPTIHTIYPLIPIIFLAWPTRRKRTGSDTVARGDASHGSNDMFDLGKTHGESYTSEAARRPSTRREAGLTTCTTIHELKRIVLNIQLLLMTSAIHTLAPPFPHHYH